ncbi:MAG TPA: FAD-binding oxidoreductase, partial [Chitinophagales bacterium]|nr:FAD-binding oxidoreductase [Chitinophagales bacterium]
MSYKKITAEDIAWFKTVVGEEYVYTDEASIEKYSRDETDGVKFPPEVVIKPITTQEVSAIMRYCNEQRIPVSPRAAGTGLSANSLCVHGGVMLTVERMNRILQIDERSLQVTTEPGVITEALQNTLQEKGLFYP